MKRMGLVALMALLCLPMGALAVREGVIEDAPMVEARRKTSYLPMHRVVVEETGWMLEEAYTEIDTREMSYDDIRAHLTSNCRLTTGERKRMEKLMAAYAAGNGRATAQACWRRKRTSASACMRSIRRNTTGSGCCCSCRATA